jgi:hypothetical protein
MLNADEEHATSARHAIMIASTVPFDDGAWICRVRGHFFEDFL